MMSILEHPGGPIRGVRAVLADFGPIYAANGFVGFVFAASGPVAIILSVGAGGGLTAAEIASWIFGGVLPQRPHHRRILRWPTASRWLLLDASPARC